MPNSVINLTQILTGDNASQQQLSAATVAVASSDTGSASDGNLSSAFSGVLRQAVSTDSGETSERPPVGTGLPAGGKLLPEELQALSVTLPQGEVETPIASADVDSLLPDPQQDAALEQGVPFLYTPQDFPLPLQESFSLKPGDGLSSSSPSLPAIAAEADSLPEQGLGGLPSDKTSVLWQRGSLTPPSSDQQGAAHDKVSVVNEMPSLSAIEDINPVERETNPQNAVRQPVSAGALSFVGGSVSGRGEGEPVPALSAAKPDSDGVAGTASRQNAAELNEALRFTDDSENRVTVSLSALLSSDDIGAGATGEETFPEQAATPVLKTSGFARATEQAEALHEELPETLQKHRADAGSMKAQAKTGEAGQLAGMRLPAVEPEAISVSGLPPVITERQNRPNTVWQDSRVTGTKKTGALQTPIFETDPKPSGVAEKMLSPIGGKSAAAFQAVGKDLPETADRLMQAGVANAVEQSAAAQTDGRNGNAGLPASFSVSPTSAPVTANSPASVPATAQQTLDVPVGHSAWEQSMAKQVFQAGQHQLQTLQIRLNPANLGVLDVHIAVESDNTHIMFSSHHAVVREAVEGAIPRLREMFTASGMNLGDVNVANHNASQEQGRDPSSGNQFSAEQAGMSDAADVLDTVHEPAEGKIPVAGEQLLDYYI